MVTEEASQYGAAGGGEEEQQQLFRSDVASKVYLEMFLISSPSGPSRASW